MKLCKLVLSIIFAGLPLVAQGGKPTPPPIEENANAGWRLGG